MKKLAFVTAIFAAMALSANLYAYQGEEVTNGGTISGTVKYEGTPPAAKKVNINKDKAVCGKNPHTAQDLVVGADKGIEYAVVTIKGITKGVPMKPASVEFDQKGCEYRPHVLAFPAGSTVDIKNSDGILHNIHTYSKKNPAFNKAQPKFKKVIKIKVAEPEVIKVTCDAHGWMHGWWYAADSPYYAVTDAKGNFTIKNVPAGDYTLEVWHEKLGTQDQKVSVKSGGVTTVNFSLKPKS